MARASATIATPAAATYGSVISVRLSETSVVQPSIVAAAAKSALRPDQSASATMTVPPARTLPPCISASDPNAVARTSGGASSSRTPIASAASRSRGSTRHAIRPGTNSVSAIVATPAMPATDSKASGAAVARTPAAASAPSDTTLSGADPRFAAPPSSRSPSARTRTVRAGSSDRQLQRYVGAMSASAAAICAGVASADRSSAEPNRESAQATIAKYRATGSV